MRRAVFLSVAVLVPALAVGCSATPGQSANGPALCPDLPPSTHPVTLTLWTSFAGEGHEVEAFNGSQHAVRVVVVNPPVDPATSNPYPGGPPPESMFFHAVDKHLRLPDVVTLSGSAAKAAIDTGTLVPAADCIASFHTDMSGFVPAAVEDHFQGGTQWGMPLGLNGMLEAYNAQAFSRAGLDPDNLPTDLGTLVKDAQAIQAHGTTTPLGDNDLTTLLRASGGNFTDHADGRTGPAGAAAVDNPTTRGVLATMLQELADNLIATPPDRGPNNGNDPELIAMGTGSVAVHEVGPGDLGQVAPAIAQGQAPGLTLRFGPIPSLHGPGAVVAESDGLYLTTASSPAVRAAAWRFISWWEQPAQQAQWAADGFAFPDQRTAVDQPVLKVAWDRYPFLRQAFDVMSTSPYVTDDPIGPVVNLENTSAGIMFHDVVGGESIDAAVADAGGFINRLLTDYKDDPRAWDRCYEEPGVNCG